MSYPRHFWAIGIPGGRGARGAERAMALVLMVLCTSGCASPSPSEPSTTAPTSAPPAVMPSRCVGRQLLLTTGTWGAAAGTDYINLRIGLANGPPCTINAEPAVSITDATGVVIAGADAGPADPMVVREAVRTELGWSSWCAPAPRRPLRLTLTFEPGSLALTTLLPDGFFSSDCMGRQGGTFLNRPFGTD